VAEISRILDNMNFVFHEQNAPHALLLSSHPHVARIRHLELEILLWCELKARRRASSSALLGKLQDLKGLALVY
jgi:hypothetical protein